MASATKRNPKAVSKQAAKSAGRSPAKHRSSRSNANAPGLEQIAEPERSAPALAEVDAEALEFIEAIDRFKKQHGRPFPSWSEVLLIVRQLGYRRG